jgi:hypothetical protein
MAVHDLQRRSFHGLEVLVVHPSGVEHRAEILGDLLGAHAPAYVAHAGNVRVGLELVVLAVEDGLHRRDRGAFEEELVEVDLKP